MIARALVVMLLFAQPVLAEPATSAPKPAQATATAPKPAPDEEDGEPRLSLPTEADRQAWQRSGFRLFLGGGYGEFLGLRGAPSGRLIAATLRAGLRLDATWSLLASFQYARASQAGGLSGLRFAATIDPTLHVTPSLALSLGFGLGGIVEARNTGRMDADPLPATLETSYTFPDASTPISSCSGGGVAGLARVDWGYVLGPRSQLSLSVEALGQWTRCINDTNRFEPDSGQPIVRRQYWPHTGLTLSAGITWR